MIFSVNPVLRWVRTHLELSAAWSIVAAFATFVAGGYYRSYYSYYSIDSANITIPLAASVLTFLVIVGLAGALAVLTARADRRGLPTVTSAFIDNVPLLVLLTLLSALAIDLYWSNVELVSSWIEILVRDRRLTAESRRLTPTVVAFLRTAMVVGPATLPILVVAALSLRRFSFARFLNSQTRGMRYSFLGLYLVLTLLTSSAMGHLVAYLQYERILDTPDVSITLADGSMLAPSSRLFLITKSDADFYVATKSDGSGARVRSWLVPRSAIKTLELGSRRPDTLP